MGDLLFWLYFQKREKIKRDISVFSWGTPSPIAEESVCRGKNRNPGVVEVLWGRLRKEANKQGSRDGRMDGQEAAHQSAFPFPLLSPVRPSLFSLQAPASLFSSFDG